MRVWGLCCINRVGRQQTGFWCRKPQVINTDKNPAYGEAIIELKKEGLLPKDTRHRQVKYLNNRLESDHGKLKRLIKPMLGFQSMKTAYATIKGFEVMRMFRKGQFKLWIERGRRDRGVLRQPAVRHLCLKTEPGVGGRSPYHNLCNGAGLLPVGNARRCARSFA